jgi:DNA-binding transcriptional ArsR family regulator
VVDAERVEAARKELPTGPELEGLTGLFRLLGDATRARLLYALLEAGELGVVHARRAGRMIHYRLEDSHVRMLLDLTREHLRHTESEKG